MKTIVLAEKPSVAREYAKVLNCNKKNKGSLEGKDYIITWALGHLVTLASPQDYDQKYKEWNLEDLPMLPQQIRLKVIKKSSLQFRNIKEIIHRKDIKNFIIATDAGREGELVARWIMILAGWKGSFQRLWISSQTKKAILDGFSSLKNGWSYNNLFNAAVGRSEADWLIGLNVTRALTCKFNAQLSAGRVQTPTLAMIINREEEIKKFEPVDFWRIEADFSGFIGEWRDPKGNTRIFDQNRAKSLINRLQGQPAIIINLIRETKKIASPAAYDLTELQRDANNRFNFSAKKTLSIVQQLYERHKIVSYPRTDSRYITSDMVSTIPDRLKAISVAQYEPFARTILGKPVNAGRGFVNDRMVTDHHAIIPTEEKLDLSVLSIEEKKIYDLIARRFLMVLSPNYIYEQVVIILLIGGEKFYSKTKLEKDKGWKKIGGRSDQEEVLAISPEILTKLRKGIKQPVVGITLKKSKTSPPARYTEASLLTGMESPGKFIKDKELAESIKGSGLGTPATRADIIEKLVNSDYIYRESRHLIPTPKGYQLIDLVPEDLKSPELTAKWEQTLKKISEGRGKKEDFITDIITKTRELVSSVKSNTKIYKPYNQTTKKCPLCSNFMLLIKGRKGNIHKCSDLKCGHVQDENKKEEFLGRKSKKDSWMNKSLIKKYSDNKNKSSGVSIGSLFEDALKKNK